MPSENGIQKVELDSLENMFRNCYNLRDVDLVSVTNVTSVNETLNNI
ncbi:MAG: hypothetical protein ACI4PE_03035 [Bacilli bacterium]